MSRKELIQNEIQLAEDECCIVFDFGCFFPYANQEILTFDFSLGMEEFTDYKHNHRYPNNGYITISKKYGRKVSKLGYPYVMKLNEQSPMLLCIKVGIKNEHITMIFPIKTSMTKEKPICGLSFHFNFDKSEFIFQSHEKAEDCGWIPHCWSNHEFENFFEDPNNILLTPPHPLEENSHTAIYDEVIEPFPTALLDLLVL